LVTEKSSCNRSTRFTAFAPVNLVGMLSEGVWE
jgi:hypothetical protein